MYIIGNLSLNFSTDYETTALPFNIFLTLAYLLIFLQYYLRGKKIGFNRDIKLSLVIFASHVFFFGSFTLLTGFGLWSYDQIQVWFYYLPFICTRIIHRKLRLDIVNFPHMVERCQLITIITFGEAVVAILNDYPASSLLLEGALLFFAMAFLFIFYISQTYLNINHHHKAPVTLLLYSHLVILLGINFFTVAIETLASHHSPLGNLFLALGMGLFYLGTLLTSRYNHDHFRISKTNLLHYSLVLFGGILAIFLVGHQLIPLFLLLNLIGHLMLYIYYRYRKNIKATFGIEEE